MRTNVGLELEHVLLREYVRHNLALARMLKTRARVEEAALDRDEGIVEVGLERARPVAVDDLKRIGVRDREVVGRYAHESACVRA